MKLEHIYMFKMVYFWHLSLLLILTAILVPPFWLWWCWYKYLEWNQYRCISTKAYWINYWKFSYTKHDKQNMKTKQSVSTYPFEAQIVPHIENKARNRSFLPQRVCAFWLEKCLKDVHSIRNWKSWSIIWQLDKSFL